MKLKLIDEEWIDKKIKELNETVDPFLYTNKNSDKIEVLRELKTELKTIFPHIKEAWECGMEEQAKISGEMPNHTPVTFEDYIKNKGYEDTITI